jgi:hypothetical protein
VLAMPLVAYAHGYESIDQRAAPTYGSKAPASYADWRERCFAERRVDCANPTAATFDVVRPFVPREPGWGAPIRLLRDER